MTAPAPVLVAVLDGAIDALVTDGWCQGAWVRDGAVCLEAALDRGARRLPLARSVTWKAGREARSVVGRVLVGRGQSGIVHFNDHVAESVEDVILLLKEARAQVEA